MGRNNADFHGGGWFHVSSRNNRQSIEATGLKAHPVHDEAEGYDPSEKGVYVSADPVTDAQFGTDVYAVTPTKELVTEEDGLGDTYHPADVPADNVRRVGHIVDGKVHWHPEEHCNG